MRKSIRESGKRNKESSQHPRRVLGIGRNIRIYGERESEREGEWEEGVVQGHCYSRIVSATRHSEQECKPFRSNFPRTGAVSLAGREPKFTRLRHVAYNRARLFQCGYIGLPNSARTRAPVSVYANIWKLHTADSPAQFTTSLDYDVRALGYTRRHFFRGPQARLSFYLR